MKRGVTAKYAALLAAVLLAACQKQTVEDGTAIAFAAEAKSAAEESGQRPAQDNSPAPTGTDVPQTKATKTTSSNLTSAPFGVYGLYSATQGAATGTNVFDNSSALQVSYNTTSGYWEYTRTGPNPKYYWKRNMYYRFRAYHPYTASVEAGGSGADGIIINYRIIEDQYDLLVAFATRHPATDPEGTGRVPMNFQHALSALRFRVAFRKTVDEGTTDVLTEFHLTGIQAAGVLNYTHASGDYLSPLITWSADAFDSVTEFYKAAPNKTFGVYDKDDSTTASNLVDVFGSSDADNVVFAIPQTCSDPRYGSTSVHFKTTGGGNVDNTAVLPSIEWQPGKIYTYTLLIERSSVEITVSIKDWNEVQSTVDINI
ncbi:MAG: fimbrillin family protein [Bacteroidia bacterium]|nr:fimbrillin family protein [Bacteroidia bacterium]